MVLKSLESQTNETDDLVTTLNWNVSVLLLIFVDLYFHQFDFLVNMQSCIDAFFLVQSEGTLLATGSHEGKVRMWNRYGKAKTYFED